MSGAAQAPAHGDARPVEILPFPSFRRVDFIARNARAALGDGTSVGRRRIEHLAKSAADRFTRLGVDPSIAQADALALRAVLLDALRRLEADGAADGGR